VVVKDWNHLEDLGYDEVIKGKIVLYNYKWQNYEQSVQYRVNGANRAKKFGAIAILIKSVASTSIESVHTGM